MIIDPFHYGSQSCQTDFLAANFERGSRYPDHSVLKVLMLRTMFTVVAVVALLAELRLPTSLLTVL